MTADNKIFITFLEELMRRKKCPPHQMAGNLGVSHATLSRWLSGKDAPSTNSCRVLAEYCGVSVNWVLNVAGYLPRGDEEETSYLPEFRENAKRMYPHEIDEDLVMMIEDLIDRRRQRRYGKT